MSGRIIGSKAVFGAAIAGGALASGAIVLARLIRGSRAGSFRGRIILITGSSRGLGLALAEECGRVGAKLILAARDSEELNRAKHLLVERKAAESDHILTLTADFRRDEEAKAVIETATQQFGQVDILINNAGVITAGPLESQTAESFDDVMNTNFFSAVHCSLAVLPQMLRRKNGTIVNIASIGGKVAVPHLLSYTASKFAMVGLSQGLNAELRGKGVHVLTVCPGLMRTGSHLNAQFSGEAPREYRWFSLMANLPGMSVSAKYAAKKIVKAIASKKAEIAISPPAMLAARFGQVAPGVTSYLMSAASGLLPKAPDSERGAKKGLEVRERELWPATRIGWRAAQRYNQLRARQ